MRTAERPPTYLGDAFVTIRRPAPTLPVLLLLLLAFLLAALLPVTAFASVPAAPGTASASPKEAKAGAMKRGDKDTKERTAKGDKKAGKATGLGKDKDKREIQEATGCRFAKQGGRWTLAADCTTEGTIELPAGVALDGNGHTLALAGARNGYQGAAVLAAGGQITVSNLAIDGSPLAGQCDRWDDTGGPIAAVRFADASGAIEDVSVAGHRCGAAVEVEAKGGQQMAVEVAGLTVSDTVVPLFPQRGQTGVVSFAGAVDATVTETTLRRVLSSDGTFFDDALAAIWVGDGASATIERATVEGAAIGVIADGSTSVTLRDSRLTEVYDGIEASETRLEVTGSAIVGRSEGAGVGFGEGTSGRADGNEISGFAGPARHQTACGIKIAASSQAEVGNDNRFPTPGASGANEQNVCDDRR